MKGRWNLCSILLAALGATCLPALGAAQQLQPSSATPALPFGVHGSAAGTGPWPAIAESVADFPTHTLYHPANPPAEPLPLLVWGNGACRDNGLAHGAFLREIASHGYFVISLGRPRNERGPEPPPAGVAAPAAPPPAPGTPGGRAAADETTVSQMFDAIAFAERVAADPARARQWRIDTGQVAVGGHSCGGLQSLAAAADPRIDTALIFNSGIYITPGGRSGVAIDKSALDVLHGPVAYFSGGPEDMAHVNAVDDVARITKVPVFFGYRLVGHGGTFWTEPNGGAWAEVAVRWLDWQLKGRAAAGASFLGRECGLCREPGWVVPHPVGNR